MKWLMLLACVTVIPCNAQVDSTSYVISSPDSGLVRYEGGFDFREGIYFDFQAFRNNRPSVLKEKLIGSQGERITDLHATDGKLFYQDSTGAKKRIDLDRLWGFCEKNVVYMRAGNDFNRIGLMGSLAHLTFDATYRNWGGYDGYGYSPNVYTVQEQRFLDMETGAMLPVTAAGISQAIQRDDALKQEFEALPKRKRNDEATIFLLMRRYNERHPLYFPR